MINKIFYTVLSIWVLAACSSSKSAIQQVNQAQIYADIAYLADDKLEGRAVGTPGEKLAAEYIIKRFKEIGVQPKGDHGDYLQKFTRKVRDNPHLSSDEQSTEMIVGYNVVGYIDHGADHTIVIGAHYDHLETDSEYSLETHGDGIHNGADDNASGVAGVLALAENLKKGPRNNNYILIGFSGEEQGLWGSNFYAKNPTVDLSQVNYMINMDMIGRYEADRGLAIHGTGTSPTWEDAINKIEQKNKSLKIKEHPSGVGPSDFTSFYLQDIPVLSFFTGQHEDYHKPTDDIEKLNFIGIKLVIGLITDIINYTDDKEKLSFAKTKEAENDAPKFTVTLGVIPDYLYDGKGMRIDGIRDDRPAFNAGLEKGDIVVKLGDHEVIDMMGYMKALSQFKKGDKTRVVVIRMNEEITKDLQF